MLGLSAMSHEPGDAAVPSGNRSDDTISAAPRTAALANKWLVALHVDYRRVIGEARVAGDFGDSSQCLDVWESLVMTQSAPASRTMFATNSSSVATTQASPTFISATRCQTRTIRGTPAEAKRFSVESNRCEARRNHHERPHPSPGIARLDAKVTPVNIDVWRRKNKDRAASRACSAAPSFMDLQRQRESNREGVLSRERSFFVVGVYVVLGLEEPNAQTDADVLDQIREPADFRPRLRRSATDHRIANDGEHDLLDGNGVFALDVKKAVAAECEKVNGGECPAPPR